MCIPGEHFGLEHSKTDFHTGCHLDTTLQFGETKKQQAAHYEFFRLQRPV